MSMYYRLLLDLSLDKRQIDPSKIASTYILNALKKIQSEPIQALDLGILKLGQLSNQLTEIFQTIPLSVTDLNLTDNCFNSMEIENIVAAFHSLHQNITLIDLSRNDLGVMPIDKLVQMIAALPPNVTILDLSDNELFQLGKENLIKLFNAIPATVKLIKLQKNSLAIIEKNENGALATVLNNLSKTIESVDLSENKFGTLPCKQIAKGLSALSGSVRELTLRGNYCLSLDKYISQFLSITAAITPGVTTLDLAENNLFKLVKADEHVFDALSNTNVSSLDLSSNEFNDLCPEGTEDLRNIKYFALQLSFLPLKVKCLELGMNRLYRLPLDILCKDIPESVTVLSLRGNNLSRVDIAKLKNSFAQLHHHLEWIDLSENGFSDDEKQEITEMLQQHAPQIKVSFSYREEKLEAAYQASIKQANEAILLKLVPLDLSDSFESGSITPEIRSVNESPVVNPPEIHIDPVSKPVVMHRKPKREKGPCMFFHNNEHTNRKRCKDPEGRTYFRGF